MAERNNHLSDYPELKETVINTYIREQLNNNHKQRAKETQEWLTWKASR
jgi:hypothetical protein